MATYRVQWVIDVEAESPESAALQVWADMFRRTEALPDDACVFTVNGETIDLSEL